MKRLSECRLYGFVDTAYLNGRSPQTVARLLCEGGADLIQLRAKNSNPAQILAMAESILPVTRAAGVGLVINDHVAVARQVGAEGCHLGQEDFFKAGYTICGRGTGIPARDSSCGRDTGIPARDLSNAGHTQCDELRPPGSSLQIGLSTHSPEQAQRAIAAGADYLGIGPVFRTQTKPEAQPLSLDYVRWAAGNVSIPWFAIGGITLENVDQVVSAGARCVCVVSAILNARDPAQACRDFRTHLAPD